MVQIDPDYCRGRAVEMLKRADQAPNDAVRESYWELAVNWRHLAEEIEKPFRWRRLHPR